MGGGNRSDADPVHGDAMQHGAVSVWMARLFSLCELR